MLRLIGIPMMCLAMFSIAGGHWALFQTIAWAQMLRDYSKSSTLSEAVSKTFDGEHPCPMCMKVREGRQNEDKAPAMVKADKKTEPFLCAAAQIVRQPVFRNGSYPRLTDLYFANRSDAPPRPVPRDFMA